MNTTRHPRHERIYRRLLVVYPAAYRRRHAEELVAFFRDRYRDAKEAPGLGPMAAMWIAVVADVVVHGLAERARRPTPAPTGINASKTEELMGTILKDVQLTLRTMRKQPGFAAVVVTTLAVGIGASASIFSVVNQVLLEPLPFVESDRLVHVWGRMSATEVEKAPWSGPDLIDFRERAGDIADFAAVAGFNSTLTGEYEPEPVRLAWATGNFFELLGTTPILGRAFDAGDEQHLDPAEFFGPGTTPPPSVVLISHGMWQRRYAGDPDVLGRTVHVNAQPMTIIGVTPPGFRLYMPAEAAMDGRFDVWSPIPGDLRIGTRDQQWLTVVGRLKDDATIESARGVMDGLSAELRTENQFHSNVGMEADLVPMRLDAVDHIDQVLITLLGSVGFVLLIACANVANLLLVRAHARQREMAIRAAIGGERKRIARQVLTESLVYAVAGGAGGLALAYGSLDLLMVLRPGNLPRIDAVAIDGTVLIFATGVSLVAALLFGTAPAWQSSHTDINSALRQRAARSGRHGGALRSALVVGEVALSLVLLVGAGLMMRTFAQLTRVDPGFDPTGVATVNVAVPLYSYPSGDERAAFHQGLADRIAGLPGVEAVGAVTPLPLAGGGELWFGPYALHEASDEEWSRNEVDYRPVLPGAFEALGVRLLAGRVLTKADNRTDSRDVVVIDRRMAERAWPGQTALGERIMVMRPSDTGEWDRFWAEVVGVVEHVRYDDIRRDGRGTIYFPFVDWWFTDLNYVIRSDGDPRALAESVRAAIRAADPDIPVAAVTPLNDYVAEALAPARFAFVLIAAFAGVALFLSAIGLYGVLANTVRQQTHEIGIRMAFGAGASTIVKGVVRHGLVLVGTGVAVGVVGAVLVTRALSSQLFGVEATDPVTYVALTAVLIAAGLLACWIPARRATRVDPMVSLRME